MAARSLLMPGGKPKLREEGTCRIFFSSPFGGMEEEREELTRRYFPQIHSHCSRLGLKFVAVDMRWGITSEAAERAQVINICLRELDRSDMFVGFFGQRYGWHGAEDTLLQRNFDNAVGTYPWLGTVRDRSVTELEFLHGHLNQPGKMPAVVCFRDKAYDDIMRAEGEKKGDKKQVFKYSAESPHASTMMDDLKQRVEGTRDKLLGCHMNYSTPVEAASLIFDAVWKHLTEVLLRDFRPVAMSKLERRRAEHEAFRSSMSALYLGGQSYLQQLNDWIVEDVKDVDDTVRGDVSGDEGGDAKSMIEEDEAERGGATGIRGVLVTGPRGSGKSALLCNWLRTASSQFCLLPLAYFVGVAPSTTDPVDILSYLLDELRHHVKEAKKGGKKGEKETLKEKEHVMKDEEEPVAKGDSRDVAEILPDVALALGELGKGGTHVVLVIDGLDKVQQPGKTMKHLFWLPRVTGIRLTLLVSTLDSDTDSLAELLEQRHYRQLSVQPLDLSTQQQLCVETLKESGKELSTEQLNRVVAAPQTQNPLFLKVALHELSVFGYFRELDQKIDSLIGCKDVTELMHQYLQRLESDYNAHKSHGNLVQRVLGSLVTARRGLSEAELMEIWHIPLKVWSPLYFALERYVINQGGHLRLALSELKEAVIQKYMAEESFRTEIARRLIDYFGKELQGWHPWKGYYHDECQRASDELPWLYRNLEDKEGLTATLSHLGVFAKLHHGQPFWLMELWGWLGESWDKVADLYTASADQAVVECYLEKVDRPDLYSDSNSHPDSSEPCFRMGEFYNGLWQFFDSACHWPGVERFLDRQLEVLKGHVPIEMAESYLLRTINVRYQLACVYVETDRYDKAEALHLQVQEEYKKLLEGRPGDTSLLQHLAFSNNGLGVLAEKQGDWVKAEEFFQESLRLHRALGNTKEEGECYTNLGVVSVHRGNAQEALDYCVQAEKIIEETYPGQLHPMLGNLLANKGLAFRRLNRLDEAKACYTRSLEIKANALGWGHLSLTVTYVNLGMLDLLASNSNKATEHYQRALDLFKNYNIPADNPDHLRCLESMVSGLLNQGKHHEALPIYKTILEVYESRKMKGCLPSVHQEMIKFFLTEGLMDEAERVVVALLESDHRDPVNFAQLEILDRQRDPLRRLKRPPHLSLRHALSLYPGDIRVTREVMIREVIPKEDKEELFRLLADVNVTNPDFAHTTYSFGCIVCVDQGHHDLAISVLEHGLTLYPGNQDLKIELLETLRKAGKWGEAADVGEELLTDMADNASLVFVTGHSALQAGQLTRAMEMLSRAASMEDADMADKAKMLLKIIHECETEQEVQVKEASADQTEAAENVTSGALVQDRIETLGEKDPSESQRIISNTTCAQLEEMQKNALRQNQDEPYRNAEGEPKSPLPIEDLQAANKDLSPNRISSVGSEIRRNSGNRRSPKTVGKHTETEGSNQKSGTPGEVPSQQNQKSGTPGEVPSQQNQKSDTPGEVPSQQNQKSDTPGEVPSQQNQKAGQGVGPPRRPRDKLTQPSKEGEQ